MELQETFRIVARSIVAFGSKVAKSTTGQPPIFPEIVGTGFVIDSRGVVATNRHVVEALQGLPKHPSTGEFGGFALVFSDVEAEGEGHSLKAGVIEIRRADVLGELVSDDGYYGDPTPDIGFVQIDVSGIPELGVETEPWSWRVGMPVATAGFAMGTVGLTIYEKLNCLTPMLRHGVISSVFPFDCPGPHGFTVDIMTQGGESGSPIFRPEKPSVLGLLHAGFNNTNITIAVPSFMVKATYDAITEAVAYDFSDVPPLESKWLGKGASKPSWDVV